MSQLHLKWTLLGNSACIPDAQLATLVPPGHWALSLGVVPYQVGYWVLSHSWALLCPRTRVAPLVRKFFLGTSPTTFTLRSIYAYGPTLSTKREFAEMTGNTPTQQILGFKVSLKDSTYYDNENLALI